jgi:hypothetical protein
VSAEDVRQALATMLQGGAALAISGRVPRGSSDRARAILGGHGLLR